MEKEELKAALRNVRKLHVKMNRKLMKAEKLEEKALSIGKSIYKITKGNSNHPAPQEMLCDAVDLRKSALADLETIYDLQLILGPELEKIKDLDIKYVIDQKYLRGCSDEEVAELYEKNGMEIVRETELRFFQDAYDLM